MTGFGTVAVFLLVALLVPIALLAVVRLASWALPPSVHWATAFEARHRFALSLMEAAFWLLLFAQSFAWPNDSWFSDWFFRALGLLLAAQAISRAIRHKRSDRAAPAVS